jgi:quinol monooxygenase YgiN
VRRSGAECRPLSLMDDEPMVVIAGHYRVEADQRDGLVAAFTDLLRRARAAEGALHVSITADPVEPDRVNMLEVWRDAAALERWRAVADAPQIDVEMHDVQVARYDATDGGPLFP